MASLSHRTLKDGATVYRVTWRPKDPDAVKKQTVETFDPREGRHRDRDAAVAFKHAVEAFGHCWPPNYAPGQGYLNAEAYAEAQKRQGAGPAEPVPFEQYASQWLETVANGLEDGTAGRYRQILANHLIPAFGHLDIRDPGGITPLLIGRWITALRHPESEEDEEQVAGLSPKTVRNLHGLLSAILQSAVEREVPLRERNPCRESGKHLPRLDEGDEMVFLSPGEYDLIRGQIIDGEARDLADCLYGTGLRYSEATALRAMDFHLDARRANFQVRKAWKQESDGSYKLGDPKTEAAKRTVYLTPVQVEAWGKRLAGLRRESLVFQGPNGGRFVHDTFYSQRWRPAVYRAARCVQCRSEDYAAGVGRRGYRYLRSEHVAWCGHEGQLEVIPRVHDLRHSHVAALIGIGTPLLAISRRLGHKSIQITQDRYGHLLPHVHDDLLDGLDALLATLGGRV
jgi:integrase